MKAYVVGGGDSAKDFDWSEVGEGDLTVACHDAANRMPFAPTVQLSIDRPYWEQNKPRLGSAGVWVTVGGLRNLKKVCGSVIKIPPTTSNHWDKVWGEKEGPGVMCGGCSGVAAVNYAYKRGATEIHLVGVDLDGEGGKWENWRDTFTYAVQACEQRGVKVVCRGKWAPVSA